MTTLREAMRAFLTNWRADLSEPWRELLSSVEPAFEDVGADLELHDGEVIFPGRKGSPVPGAPPRAHVFRALDGIRPSAVRVVILGQDPYPKLAWATGRAFEQGDITAWPRDRGDVAPSLARIIQVLAAARTGRSAYKRNDAAWRRVVDDLESGDLELQPPHRLFGELQRQGVLFLNTGLTLTRFQRGGAPEQLRGHIPLWRPIVRQILTRLATRTTGHVVFLLWGKPARAVFSDTGVEDAARAAGTWSTRVAALAHTHPASVYEGRPTFFRAPNPFTAANESLGEMGADPIEW
jgi:uracil-DNA glycosylase